MRLKLGRDIPMERLEMSTAITRESDGRLSNYDFLDWARVLPANFL